MDPILAAPDATADWLDFRRAAQADGVARALLLHSQQARCCQGDLARSGPSAPYFFGDPARSWTDAQAGRPAPTAPSPAPVVLPAVHIVNPGEAAIVADVRIEKGVIASISPPGIEQSGATVFEAARGSWILPGLIDMHVHLPGRSPLDLTPHYLRMFAIHGVTGMRVAGDIDGTSVPAVGAEDPERIPVPRLCAARHFVGRPPFRWKHSLHYESPEDASRIIGVLQQSGEGCIKLYENLTAADIRVLQDAAQKAGLVVMGHVPSALSLEEAGIADSQHFFGVPLPASLRRDHVFSRTADWRAVDERRLEAVAVACERHGLANTPTLVVSEGLLRYRNLGEGSDAVAQSMPGFFADVIWSPTIGLPAYRGLGRDDFDALEDALGKKQRLVRELHRRGCDLFLGTDTSQPFSVPGQGLLREMGLFAQAGIPVPDILKMATVRAAERLGWKNVGRIAEGYAADLVSLPRDPSADLSALQEANFVVLAGRLHSVPLLRTQVAEDLRHRNATFRRIASHVLARVALYQAARNFVG